MDKHSTYVSVVYAVTFVLLLGYLIWMTLRLRALREEDRE